MKILLIINVLLTISGQILSQNEETTSSVETEPSITTNLQESTGSSVTTEDFSIITTEESTTEESTTSETPVESKPFSYILVLTKAEIFKT